MNACICYKQKCKVVSLNLAHPVYFLFFSPRKQKRTPESFDVNNCVIIMAHVM